MCRGGFIATMLVLMAGFACAAPKRFQERALLSPDKQHAANVEWEDVGFVGIIRMKIYDGTGRLQRVAEVPEIDPEPANLVWINNEWVASESFLGERAGGFFYVHAPTGKGYLIEIVEPRPGAHWIFTIASNDAISSAAVANVSRQKTSIFPILLRNVPDSEMGFFAADFVRELTAAVDTYNEFRKQNGVTRIDLLSDSDIRDNLGGIVVAGIDGRAEVIYFPAGARTPQEMLSRVRRQVLPEDVQEMLKQPDAPELRPRWLEGGEYVVESTTVPLGMDPLATSTTVLLRSKFDGVSDKPYVRGEDEAVAAETTETATAAGDKKAAAKASPTPKTATKSKPEVKVTTTKKKVPATSDKKASPTPKPKAKTRLDVKKPHEKKTSTSD